MNAWNSVRDAWARFWFSKAPTPALDIVRACVGALMFVAYGSMGVDDVRVLYGNEGYVSLDAMTASIEDPWTFSLLFYVQSDWQLLVFYTVFVLSCLALGVGWRTRWTKWLVLIGHISLMNRNPATNFGVDPLLASILLLICLAPEGGRLSLDRVRIVRTAKREDLSADPAAPQSAWAFACVRLIQLQMCAFFFYSGFAKVLGPVWVAGDALWFAVVNNKQTFLPLWILASNYWMVPALTYFTIVVELIYPALIWGRLRPVLIACAVSLHLGIAIFLGLWFFSLTAISGHLIFLRPAWLARAGARWKARMGPMEMIYDGDCGFCKRSMAWFLAFDGLRQISIRNYRTDPSPVVPSEKVDEALYVVTGDGTALPGFDAYRYVVLRVPGHWWMVPFFYVPVLSKAVGRPVYRWIASNRHAMPF